MVKQLRPTVSLFQINKGQWVQCAVKGTMLIETDIVISMLKGRLLHSYHRYKFQARLQNVLHGHLKNRNTHLINHSICYAG